MGWLFIEAFIEVYMPIPHIAVGVFFYLTVQNTPLCGGGGSRHKKYVTWIVLSYLTIVAVFTFGVAVLQMTQFLKANTCAAIGNPFNDLRICEVCGTNPGWENFCFDTAPYSPPVTIESLEPPYPIAYGLLEMWISTFMSLEVMYLIYKKYSADQLIEEKKN